MKEKSYMLALPGEQEPEGRMEVLRRLKNAPDFKVVTADTEDEGSLELTVEYKGNRYRALLYPTGFELPEFYRCQHLFPDVDIEVMERAESGLAVEMMFGEDALDSYHLQLKLIHAVLPDAVAVLDDSSERYCRDIGLPWPLSRPFLRRPATFIRRRRYQGRKRSSGSIPTA